MGLIINSLEIFIFGCNFQIMTVINVKYLENINWEIKFKVASNFVRNYWGEP